MPKRPAVSYLFRRRWTVTDARAVLASLAASGLSVRAFAHREGFDVQRLYRWRRELGDERRATMPPSPVSRPASAPELIEIRGGRAEAALEIVLPSGIIVRVAGATAPSTVAELISALELRRPSC